MSNKFVSIVTGGNKGIGRAIVHELAKQYQGSKNLLVYLAARDPQRGKQATDELSKEIEKDTETQIQFLPLDISNEESIRKAVDRVKNDVGHVDVLINNAGVASKGDAFDGTVARNTLAINYWGTRNTTLAFLPLISKEGRIVNVSSSVGKLKIVSEELRNKFSAPGLDLHELDGLMKQFVMDVEDGTYSQKGWPRQAYGTSKVGVTALTRVVARLPEVNEKNILVATCCPGWVRLARSR